MNVGFRSFSTNERVSRAKQILTEFRLKAERWPIEAADPEPLAEQSGRWLAKQGVQALLSLTDEIEQGIARILDDRHFSNEGKLERLRNLADGLRPKLSRIEKMATEKLGRELETTRIAFTQTTTGAPGTDLVNAIAGMELRGYLRQMADTERLDLLWRAVREGDSQTVSAFASAPKALRLIDDGVLHEALDEFRRRANPALAESLDGLEAVHATITGYLRNVEDAMDALSGVEKQEGASTGGSSK